MKRIPLSNGSKAIVDDDDYERLKGKTWLYSNGYAVVQIWLPNLDCPSDQLKIPMHAFIINSPVGKEVDHINRDRLDNRKRNLRVCTRAENSANKVARSANGYKGVQYRNKGIKRWQASIGIKGKNLHLGLFDSAEEAARAYDKAAHENFGEFAWLNFPA